MSSQLDSGRFSHEKNQLADWFYDHQTKLEAWFDSAFKIHPKLPYVSVDIRDSGYKCVSVDANLFPAGFNNLAASSIEKTTHAFKELWPHPKKILLIPENHTRNEHYLDSVRVLSQSLLKADLNVTIGSLLDTLEAPISLNFGSENLVLSPLKKNKKLLDEADIILLNHDLSEGIPPLLASHHAKLTPSPQLGWHRRLKSNHFKHYQNLAFELSQLLNIDPWFLSPINRVCDNLDLKTSAGEACLMRQVEMVLSETSAGLKQHQINAEPFVIIKADSGTYGMAVMSAHSPQDVHQLNRKQRIKMSTTKGGRAVAQALVQEGIHSTNRFCGHVAEPVLYMVGQRLVGGFWRYHERRADSQNLNTPGMKFAPIDIDEEKCLADPKWYLYLCVARLANLAAGRELLEVS